MQTTHQTSPARQTDQTEREARGLRPIVLWVPDTRRPGFADEIRRQLARVEADANDREDLDLIEAAADWSA